MKANPLYALHPFATFSPRMTSRWHKRPPDGARRPWVAQWHRTHSCTVCCDTRKCSCYTTSPLAARPLLGGSLTRYHWYQWKRQDSEEVCCDTCGAASIARQRIPARGHTMGTATDARAARSRTKGPWGKGGLVKRFHLLELLEILDLVKSPQTLGAMRVFYRFQRAFLVQWPLSL